MSEVGPNERMEPLPNIIPLHLHERAGMGAGGQSKKDPTNVVNGVDPSNPYYPSVPGFFPPMSLLPFDFPMPPPLEFPAFPEFPPFIPGELPAPEGGDAPSNDQPPTGSDFPFVYAEGGWWAFTSVIGWFKFTAPFPTSDPGGGQVWLSPT